MASRSRCCCAHACVSSHSDLLAPHLSTLTKRLYSRPQNPLVLCTGVASSQLRRALFISCSYIHWPVLHSDTPLIQTHAQLLIACAGQQGGVWCTLGLGPCWAACSALKRPQPFWQCWRVLCCVCSGSSPAVLSSTAPQVRADKLLTQHLGSPVYRACQ